MRRKNSYSTSIITGLFLIVILAALLAIYVYYAEAYTPKIYNTFYVNGKQFDISSVAITQKQLYHGLMNTTVTNSTLMLFVFPSTGNYPFWMYDTYSNLDIIWVNNSANGGTVVYVAYNTTPCDIESECAVYNPNAYANYVIETKAGFANENNITIGSKIIFK